MFSSVSGDGLHLMMDFKEVYEGMVQKRVYHAIWDTFVEPRGGLPEARKGACMALVRHKLYLFGGMASETFNDMMVFDTEKSIWSTVKLA